MEEKIYNKIDFIAFCFLVFTVRNTNIDDIWGVISLIIITVLYWLPVTDFKRSNKLFSFSFSRTDKTDEDNVEVKS